MYFQYGIYVVPAILIMALAAWLYLKASGRYDPANRRVLVLGTILSLAIAMLVPAIARVFVQILSLSIFLSVAFAFLLITVVLGIGFLIVRVMILKNQRSENTATAVPEELITQLAVSSEAGYGESGNSGNIGEIEQKIVDTGRNTDKIGIVERDYPENDIKRLLESALDHKMRGNPAKAVECYREILRYNPENGLAQQIIIDICGMAKHANNKEIIREILDSEQGNLLDYEVKAEIMNNI